MSQTPDENTVREILALACSYPPQPPDDASDHDVAVWERAVGNWEYAIGQRAESIAAISRDWLEMKAVENRGKCIN